MLLFLAICILLIAITDVFWPIAVMIVLGLILGIISVLLDFKTKNK